jgi:hypothetical protein
MQNIVIDDHLAPVGLAGVRGLHVREFGEGFVRWNIGGDLVRLGRP